MLSFWIPFTVISYIFSCWWIWDYGASFGMRPFVEFYPVFLLFIAVELRKLSAFTNSIVFLAFTITIPLNLIQSYQYKNYIMKWGGTSKKEYWRIFFKTDHKYRGWNWKREIEYEKFYTKLGSIDIKEISLGTYKDTTYHFNSTEFPQNLELTKSVKIQFNYDFPVNDDSEIIFSIYNNKGENIYWHQTHTLHYCNSYEDIEQLGYFNYEFDTPWSDTVSRVSFEIYAKKVPITLENIAIKFYKLN